MPVGPLSLSDEVALDLGLKIMKATEADLGPNAINPDQKKLMVETGREAGPPRPQEQQGLLRLSREGQGPEEPVAGPVGAAAEAARSRYARHRGVEAALPGGAGGGSRAHGRGSRHHRSARGRCRLDPRLRLCAVHRRHAVLYRLHGHAGSSSSSATSSKPNTARASPRRNCWKTWRPGARPSTAASRRRSRRRSQAAGLVARMERSEIRGICLRSSTHSRIALRIHT